MHGPVLMDQILSLISFVLESYHCFHDITCASPTGFNILLSYVNYYGSTFSKNTCYMVITL
jgi:hypothetical protein